MLFLIFPVGHQLHLGPLNWIIQHSLIAAPCKIGGSAWVIWSRRDVCSSASERHFGGTADDFKILLPSTALTSLIPKPRVVGAPKPSTPEAGWTVRGAYSLALSPGYLANASSAGLRYS